MGTRYVGVVGPGDGATPDDIEAAREVGRLLGEAGAVLVCGGLGGVMAAACEGAVAAGGLTVGLLPGTDRAAANQHVSVALPTGLGELRNGLLVRCCDAVIGVGGSWGTLSELALARRTGVPVVVLGSWHVTSSAGPEALGDEVASPAEAVNRVLRR
ncbi:MAG: TIGR00725 family protein [Actinomycetes bacterium]